MLLSYRNVSVVCGQNISAQALVRTGNRVTSKEIYKKMLNIKENYEKYKRGYEKVLENTRIESRGI